MSSWIVVTLRGKDAVDYEYSREDYNDPWDATADIAASVDSDPRVRRWETWKGHVYAYLNTVELDHAEEFLQEYSEMIKDGVILRANDTSDSGSAYYYDTVDYCSHEYNERGNGYVGERALAVISSQHGIMARDPFHNETGMLNDRYLEDGIDRVNQ